MQRIPNAKGTMDIYDAAIETGRTGEAAQVLLKDAPETPVNIMRRKDDGAIIIAVQGTIANLTGIAPAKGISRGTGPDGYNHTAIRAAADWAHDKAIRESGNIIE